VQEKSGREKKKGGRKEEINQERTGVLEVTRVSETVGANGTKVGQLEETVKDFADVTATLLLRQFHRKDNAARDHADLTGEHLNKTHLRHELQATELRD